MNALQRLAEQLAQVESLLATCPLDLRVAKISGWTVGQQLDHLTLVLVSGFALLDQAREPLTRGINLTGRLLLGLGWLPRGVARSPESVRPRGADATEIRERLAALRRRLAALASEPAPLGDRRPRIPHPFFGGLSPAQGLRFLVVHTHHHLKIVRDIRRTAAVP